MNKGIISNSLGDVIISPEVVALYAGSQEVECFGIVGMAVLNVRDGIVRLLKKDSLNKGIKVEIKDNKININFHVIVSYGVSIKAVCDNLIENVKYKLESFTGMQVESINVYVEGVRVID